MYLSDDGAEATRRDDATIDVDDPKPKKANINESADKLMEYRNPDQNQRK